jgi:hypothetical protein
MLLQRVRSEAGLIEPTQREGLAAQRTARSVRSPLTPLDLTACLEPANGLRPYSCVGGTPDERAQMRQTHANFAGEFDDAGILDGHFVDEWRHRGQWCDFVSANHECKHRNFDVGGSNRPIEDRQDHMTEAILAIKPLENLIG